MGKGSMTVEAAVCLSLMIFAMTVLILPMNIMNTRRQLQAGLETVNEELCQYAYITYRLEQNDQDAVVGLGDQAGELASMVVVGSAQAYATSWVLSWVDTNRVINASMSRSSVLEDGEMIELILDYEVQLPFPILLLNSIPQTITSSRRAWIGRAGQSYGDDGSLETDDPIVYLGKGSTRYHIRRDCHYLSNNLEAVMAEQVDQLRNTSGGKYYPCSVCGGGNASIVYIMPNGARYHTQMQCRSIVAYVQTVRLSEAIHLGGCSYCAK